MPKTSRFVDDSMRYLEVEPPPAVSPQQPPPEPAPRDRTAVFLPLRSGHGSVDLTPAQIEEMGVEAAVTRVVEGAAWSPESARRSILAVLDKANRAGDAPA